MMAKTFKTASLGYGYGALNNNADTLRDFVNSQPELLQQIGGPEALENYIQQHQQAMFHNPESAGEFQFSPETQAIDQLLQGYQMNSVGAEGMENGRAKAVVQDGQTLFTGDPYSYNPAKDNLDTALKGAALIGGTAGLSSLAGGFTGNALQGIPAQAGDFGAVAGGGAGGSLVSGGGILGGGGMAGGGMTSLIPGLSNSTLFSVGGNLLSGLLQSNSAGKASDALTAAGREANALQKYMYDQTRADYAPYREAGTTALGQIQNLLADPSAIMQQPDYQFGLNQGINARDQSAAQNGMLYSGAQQKALTQYGNDYAGSKLNESYNRLAGIAGIGQQATGSTTQAGMNYGNQVGNTLQGMGNARASGYVGQGNAWGQAFGNILNDYQQQDVYKQMGWGG